MESITPTLCKLLGVDLLRNVDGTESASVTPTSTGIDGFMGIFEIKLEPGIGGDAKTQAERSYARTCSSSKVRLLAS
jgi:hypothetical protein